jgi:outer membrane biosynthesis protein TonB
MVKPAGMENSANIMRIALILSIIGHVLFVTFSARDLRPTAHGDSMTVDLIPANEAPGVAAAPKSDASAEQSNDAKPEPKADALSSAQAPAAKVESKPNEPKAPNAKTPEPKIAQAKPAPPAAATKAIEQKPPQPQQPPTEQQPPQPLQPTEQKLQPAQTAAHPPAPDDPQPTAPREMPPDMNRLAEALGLPFGDNADVSGASRERMAKLTEGVREFKAQVKKCLTLPPGVAPNQRIKMVIRVELTRQGALAQDPAVLDAANPSIGYPLMQSVMRALRQCAPYSLPPDKYKEWRVLDIDFSPDQMMGS